MSLSIANCKEKAIENRPIDIVSTESQPLQHKLAAILYADVEGYSRLTGQDESGTHRTLSAYLDLFAETIRAHRGEVKHYAGDAVLADFSTVSDALNCAVAVQQAIKEKNNEIPQAKRVQFRIGLNLGEVIVDRGEVYGNGVNVAARLETLAEPGGICVSGNVVDAVGAKLALHYEYLGEHRVKNIDKPVRAYRVSEAQHASSWQRSTFFLMKRLGSTRKRSFVFAGLAVLIVAAALAWQFTRSNWQAEDPVLALPTGPSIAVLPFSNLSGDPAQEYFADGVSEEIITQLTRFRELFVIARNSTFRYKGQAVDVRQVGRELGVRYVLEGSLRKAPDRIRVTAQLVDATSGAYLWAETYDRKLTAGDILGIQDEITEHVVAKIAEPFGVISRAGLKDTKSKRTDNLTAYECVLHARAHVETEASPELHLRARDCLERAIVLDPDYAEAWAWLSEMYLDEHRFGYNRRPDPKPLDRAMNAARRAVALDPTSAMGHLTLASAHFFRRELDQFAVAAEQTLALNPNNAFVLARLGVCFTGTGQLERSMALTKKAIALNPHHPSWYYFTVFMYHYRNGAYEEALAAAQKWNEPEFFWNQVHLAQAYAYLGRKKEAQAAIAKLLKLYPDFPKNAWKEWRIWLMSEDIIQHEAEGLRKAGLDIPPETK